MRVCTQSCHPARQHFWLKCLPNDKQIENTLKLKYFSKNVYCQKVHLQHKKTQWTGKYVILMKSAIVKKAGQDKKQNQRTITTNKNFIQKLFSIKKEKLFNKAKLASDKTEKKQKNKWYFAGNKMGPPIIRLGDT